jgi:hypothetical protein
MEVLVVFLPLVLGAFFALVQAALTATRLSRGTTVRVGGERHHSLGAFVALCSGALGLAGEMTSTEAEPTSARFRGELPSGRRAEVDFTRAAWGAPVFARVRVGAHVPRFELAPADFSTRLAETFGGGRSRTGWAEFDRRFVFESGDQARLARLVRQGGGDAIARLFERGPIERLEGTRDEVRAVVPAEAAAPSELAAILDALDGLAPLLEGPVVHLSESEPARRCALCHGELDGETARADCSRCGTVLHEACWNELGRCPVLGCRGGARLSGETGPAIVVP